MPGSEATHGADPPRFASFLVYAVLLVAFVGSGVAELAAFLATAVRPAPDDVDLATAWAARPERWWWSPMIATVVAVWTPRFTWSPNDLLELANKPEGAGPATLGLIVWCVAVSLLLVWFVFGAEAIAPAILFGTAILLIGALLACRRFTRAGLPDWSSTIVVAVLLGAAMGVFMRDSPVDFDCKAGAALKLKSGEEIACRSVDWFRDRKAVLLRRADGSTRLVAKAAIDPAALIGVLGTDVILVDPAS